MGKDSDLIKFKQIPEAAEAVCMKVYGPYDRLNENIREVLEWIEETDIRLLIRHAIHTWTVYGIRKIRRNG